MSQEQQHIFIRFRDRIDKFFSEKVFNCLFFLLLLSNKNLSGNVKASEREDAAEREKRLAVVPKQLYDQLRSFKIFITYKESDSVHVDWGCSMSHHYQDTFAITWLSISESKGS